MKYYLWYQFKRSIVRYEQKQRVCVKGKLEETEINLERQIEQIELCKVFSCQTKASVVQKLISSFSVQN